MATRSDFMTRLKRLSATKGLDADTLDAYIDDALMALGEYQPEKVLMKKVPVDTSADGYYDVPEDASTVIKLFVHGTDIEIGFDEERDAQTGARKIRVGAIERPQWLFVGGHYGDADYSVNENTFANSARRGVPEGYDHFDIEYFRTPTIESLAREDVYTLQLYVEHLGYDHRAGEVSNLVDIRDEDPSGDSTEIKQSGIGKQFMALSKMKKDAFEARAISPYGTRDTTGRIEYFYGEYGAGYGIVAG